MTQRGRAAARPAAGRGDRGRPRIDLAARRTRLRAVIEPVLNTAGYDLEELTISRAGRRHVVRVIVDSDAGVSLDDVADVSRAVSAALDRAEETGTELINGEYQLEVSSPGVDRPLTLPRHWRRNRGRLVRVTVVTPGQLGAATGASRAAGSAGRQVTGRVVDADAERVTLDLDGELRSWAYPELGPGRVQVEFNRLDPADGDEPLTDEDEPLADEDELLGDEDPYNDEDPYHEDGRGGRDRIGGGDSPETDDDEDVEGEER